MQRLAITLLVLSTGCAKYSMFKTTFLEDVDLVASNRPLPAKWHEVKATSARKCDTAGTNLIVYDLILEAQANAVAEQLGKGSHYDALVNITIERRLEKTYTQRVVKEPPEWSNRRPAAQHPPILLKSVICYEVYATGVIFDDPLTSPEGVWSDQ